MKSLAWVAVGAAALAACAGSGGHGDAAGTGAGEEGGGATTASSSGAGGAQSGPASSSSSTSGSTGKSSSSGATTSSSSSSGMTIGATSSVTLYVTPDTSLVGKIVSAIQSATQSVHMTMYILDNTQIVNALVAAKKAGRDVRVVLNQTFPSGTVESNPTTYSTLTSAGIGVVWRNGPPNASPGAYTHEKTLVIDGKTAWIMTMNLSASAGKYNREYVAVDTDANDAAEADAIFLADFAGTSTSMGAPLVVSPTNSRSDLVALINTATTTLDVEVEEFSDTYNPGVVTAVAAAAKRGVATRVIVANSSFSSSQITAVATVKNAGAHVVVSGGTSGGSTASNPYIHAKAVTVDCSGTTCARGFIGSENFSAGSLGYNRELGLLIDNATELAKVQAAIDGDFSAGKPQ